VWLCIDHVPEVRILAAFLCRSTPLKHRLRPGLRETAAMYVIPFRSWPLPQDNHDARWFASVAKPEGLLHSYIL
jgi:hypothetical protein